MRTQIENRSFIKFVRINGLVLFQYIHLNDDHVSFVNDETQVTVFTVDHSGYTDYLKEGIRDPIRIGKFNYSSIYTIQFIFNETFLNNNPSISKEAIKTESKDFIDAERIVIKQLLNDYPTIFYSTNEAPNYNNYTE